MLKEIAYSVALNISAENLQVESNSSMETVRGE